MADGFANVSHDERCDRIASRQGWYCRFAGTLQQRDHKDKIRTIHYGLRALALASKGYPKDGSAGALPAYLSRWLPALHGEDAPDRKRFFASYVQSYLERNIRDLMQVADEMTFYNFLTVVAARTARSVVYEEIAKEVGICAPTVKQWLSILVSSRIIALVQPYHNNVLKRVVKMPLLHFLDTSLAARLLKWSSPETLEAGAMSGRFFESWVFSEIYKSYLNAGLQPPVYCYRYKGQKEIDTLLIRDFL